MAPAAVLAQNANTVRIRGAIERVDGDALQVKTRGGSDAKVGLAPDTAVTGVIKIAFADIKPGSYIGTAAVEQSEGNLKSLEVLVFPESMRGAGDGHRGYDLGPKSSMTNGTVGQVAEASEGHTLTVKYQGGEKTFLVPADAPIVTFAPASKEDLVPGAKIIITAMKQADGSLKTNRVVVGKNGLEPPM
jgi:hypothetical protein